VFLDTCALRINKTWPVRSLKPNDIGLFDVQGNVYTWCQESYNGYPSTRGKAIDDKEDGLKITANSRVLRGGLFDGHVSTLSSSFRDHGYPTGHARQYGFRVARTLPIGLPGPEAGGK
jgi:formylglycine-generating enzyme required for sulfatase activity